jgi:hypothetical protein
MPAFAVAALSRKRAELAGECEALQARLDQMRADLAHPDASDGEALRRAHMVSCTLRRCEGRLVRRVPLASGHVGWSVAV